MTSAFHLPAPNTHGHKTLAECVTGRRSVRDYSKLPVAIECLSTLLWSAQGVTGTEAERTVPSAGKLYPLYLHILVRRVAGLKPGVYRFSVGGHSLKLLDGLPTEEAVQAVGIGYQPWLSDAALIIGVGANIADAAAHFEAQPPVGERGKRYVYIETGALAQNIHLAATDLDLGCVLVAGFYDSHAKRLLKLSGEFEATALLCIAQPALSI